MTPADIKNNFSAEIHCSGGKYTPHIAGDNTSFYPQKTLNAATRELLKYLATIKFTDLPNEPTQYMLSGRNHLNRNFYNRVINTVGVTNVWDANDRHTDTTNTTLLRYMPIRICESGKKPVEYTDALADTVNMFFTGTDVRLSDTKRAFGLTFNPNMPIAIFDKNNKKADLSPKIISGISSELIEPVGGTQVYEYDVRSSHHQFVGMFGKNPELFFPCQIPMWVVDKYLNVKTK